MTPLSVLIPVRNDATNLARCLEALRGWADEVVVVDSDSTDNTAEIARDFGAKVVQFQYGGGWPKKRQWALDTYPWANQWVLLLDADELVTAEAREEISRAITTTDYAGFHLSFRIVFLGRMLKFGDTALSKLSLLRRGRGRYERRLEGQTKEMGDMEVHEHVVVDGPVGVIKAPIRHENLNSLHHYIDKHNSYSTWEAQVHFHGVETDLQPSLFGTQAQRRRWLKQRFLALPGFPLLVFFYVYILRLGILDGKPGLHYAMFRMIQYMHIKAKIYEQKRMLGSMKGTERLQIKAKLAERGT